MDSSASSDTGVSHNSNCVESCTAKSTEHFDAVESKLGFLTTVVDVLDMRSQELEHKAEVAQQKADMYAQRLVDCQALIEHLAADRAASTEREIMLKHEVARLEALLEAARLQSTFSERKLHSVVSEQRSTCDRLRASRDNAFQQRDDTLAELAAAFSDIDAMQAALADSLIYVRFLRRRMAELEQQQQKCSSPTSPSPKEDTGGVFSLHSVKVAIQRAVDEAAKCDEEERRKRVRQLQLRWHPDKNPVLREFATEVTKLINEALVAAGGQQLDGDDTKDSDTSTPVHRSSGFTTAPGAAASATATASA